MDYFKIAESIRAVIKDRPFDRSAYSDMLSCCRSWEKEDLSASHAMSRWLREQSQSALAACDPADAGFFFDIYKRTLLFDAPHDFDSFLLYMEIDRKPEKKFYAPRRHYLKPIVHGYQDIIDGKLKLLTVSLPKRAGKSQLGINFINFLSGRRPDRASLMEGTGDGLVNSFYKGCLEYLQEPNEYLFYDVFPNARIVQTNADNKTINLESKSRFPTIMCRSIDARQVGLSEATNVLYLDDCVEGREEAKNRQRLEDKWEVISGDIMGRAIEGTPYVFTGTRYSIYDPIGKVQEYAKSQNWSWRAIEIPALDLDTDESNYEYVREGKKVFTTEYFREQRDLLSAEQFESEFQQTPFEARGLLFSKDDLNYYYELPPDRPPDAVVAFADTAESGSDYVSMPVGYIYGDDVMIEDVVFDDSPPGVTKPQCANVIKRNNVSLAVFESNNAGEYYAKDVAEMLKEMGYRCSIRTRRTISNKLTRIELASDGIKARFWFKHPSTYDKKSQYADFMKNVTTFTRTGKVAHDDAPDSLAMMENGIRSLHGGGVEVLKRPV